MCDFNKIQDNIYKGEPQEHGKEGATQFILDENKNLIQISKELCLPVEYPINYSLKNAFEVFVRVDGTENYWISNYGRCVNNYMSKIKNPNCNKFYEHKQGTRHYTICTRDIDGSTWKVDVLSKKLVADTFLVKYKDRTRVWHKDGDESNNWYKNLLMVTPRDYMKLKDGKVTWQELNLEQEYIEYENKASAIAYRTYYGIRKRCGDITGKDDISRCYDDTIMCQKWLDDPKEFLKWYFEHYYEVDGETMAVDKDLFGNGSNMYSPENCCLLPQTLNNLIANCKKSYFEGQTADDVLPLGVRRTRSGYRGEITFTGSTEAIPLSEWSTPEEAFDEYKIMKQANIYVTAAKYKNKIPDYIYDRLLKVEVTPY